MTFPVVLRTEANDELMEAYHWYEDKRLGLGEEFLLVVDAVIEKIRRSPETYPTVYRHVRRALKKRFPYGVYYTIGSEEIVVLAIFHGRRDPQSAKERPPNI